MVSSREQQQGSPARGWGDSFSSAGHYQSSLRAPFPAPTGMRWYFSNTTGQWNLEVAP